MTDMEKARQLFFAGLASMEKGDDAEAERELRAALTLMPGRVSILTNMSAVLMKQRRIEEAAEYARQAVAADAKNMQAHLNLGLCLAWRHQYQEALACYERALAVQPDAAEVWLNKGVALNELKRNAEALVCHEKAVALNPDFAKAWFNRGNVLAELNREGEALECYEKALSLDPSVDFGYGNWLITKLKLCDWRGLDGAFEWLRAKVDAGELAILPFPFLAVPSSPKLQRICAQTYSRSIKMDAGGADLSGAFSFPQEDECLNIGYFSADFHNHATSLLMAELFERHDRRKVRIIAFSFGPKTDDAMQRRVKAAFDLFLDVRDLSDEAVAQLARTHRIHIAVDLKGFTQDCRPRIFAYRAAPLQVNYLGYPGTLGASCFDYLIADHALIPLADANEYVEKVVFMPHSYQVNDGKKMIAARSMSRAECGLPETGFVFACFNNNYKITPDVFDIWARLLARVPGSVLWLLRSNESVMANLRREVQQRGVSPERLVFAERMELSAHLARHQLADLFLDTLYYNAHTTASDALWAGLPVVTCQGETFAARVSASLLGAVGLAELITANREDYETLAYRLATEPGMLSKLKYRLASTRLETPLFDAGLFAQHLEVAYDQMWQRYRRNEAPEHIFVDACRIV